MQGDHGHDITNYNRAFSIGIALNVVFVAIEVSYGIASGSLALIADAGHNLSDVVGLLLAWGAHRLAGARPSETRTYGLRRATILASLTSAIILLVALGGITWEAVGRLIQPHPVEGNTVIVVAAIGVVINTATALLFVSGQKHDLNIRGAFLHMAADAGISLGVVIAGAAILFTGWLWLDPVISLLIVVVILVGTLRLLIDSVNLSLDAVPGDIDIAAIRAYLTGLEQVSEIHDLHVWALSTSETALTVHLVITGERIDNAFLHRQQQQLHDLYGIEHVTIQVETGTGGNHCSLNRPECI